MSKQFYILKYKRNEYGKRIRKDYEAHKITEKRENMRDTFAVDAIISNTLTTVTKDNLILIKTETE